MELCHFTLNEDLIRACPGNSCLSIFPQTWNLFLEETKVTAALGSKSYSPFLDTNACKRGRGSFHPHLESLPPYFSLFLFLFYFLLKTVQHWITFPHKVGVNQAEFIKKVFTTKWADTSRKKKLRLSSNFKSLGNFCHWLYCQPKKLFQLLSLITLEDMFKVLSNESNFKCNCGDERN